MPERAEQKRRARRNAAIAVMCVAVFAAAFLGVAHLLVGASSHDSGQGVEVAAMEMPTEPKYVLLIGSDSRKGTALYTGKSNEHAQIDQHADIMTLMRIDPMTLTITLVTIPRDSVLPGETSKINDSLLNNDPNEVVAAAEKLTGVEIDYYMMTTFTSFEELVDALGGIDVDVPRTISVADPATGNNIKVTAGKNKHLNGSQALVLARARKEYGDDQEALRQINVRTIETALIEKVLAFDGDIDIDKVLEILKEDTKSNIDLSVLGLVIMNFVEHADEVTIYSCSGPHKGDYRTSDGLWVVRNDTAAWQELMAAVDSGEDPTGIVELPSF